ncbi:HpyAIV family type II restriction enzyme [Pampinifervens florentissimum]|uniref:HpyAIV family type II restriction enzyme n=1 Tax=Pampinifervens florentissimum TaxID=1632019 RepID=UPI0013B49A6F|nr:restriction endonuclease [Hydrogenobacter sp. T-8]QID33654.1 restriction endonuclease [Hydrogenobacter sp. T-8]
MKCEDIISVLNDAIFGKDKQELIERLAENPERFIGLFRPTKPYAKAIQFLLQSHEIKFGDAMEDIIANIFKEQGFNSKVNERLTSNGKNLSVDILLEGDKSAYLIEVKVRDDHDSSKKEGQIFNFQRKLEAFIEVYGEYENLAGIMYFIDNTFQKNKNYYESKLRELSSFFNLEVYLFYGRELFEFFRIGQDWDNLVCCIESWKKTLPDFPVIDYDSDVEDSFTKLKGLSVSTWKKIVENEALWEEDGIMKVLFKEGTTLKELCKYFKNFDGRLKPAYLRLAELLERKIAKIYKEVKSCQSL